MIILTGRKDLSTGEVARICRVAPRTVQKWYDRGQLTGGYRIPGSQHRRFPIAAVRAFLIAHGLEVPAGMDGRFSSEA